jgi:hypothetical protein
VPDGVEGRVLTEAFADAAVAARPVRTAAPVPVPAPATGGQNGEAEALVAERLASLGYL